jgi:hypothetical protein
MAGALDCRSLRALSSLADLFMGYSFRLLHVLPEASQNSQNTEKLENLVCCGTFLKPGKHHTTYEVFAGTNSPGEMTERS